MKPCRKLNQSPYRPAFPPETVGNVHRYTHPIRTSRPAQLAERPAVRAAPSVPNASSLPPAELHRYAHPIRTVRSSGQPTMNDLLGEVLETLSRQSEQLDEVLRRLEEHKSET